MANIRVLTRLDNINAQDIVTDFLNVTSSYVVTILSTVNTSTVDSWLKNNYRSCKYVIQITQGTNYQVSEILVIHDDTTASITEYAIIETNGTLGVFEVGIDMVNIYLNVTMLSSELATIKLKKILIDK